MAEKRAEKAKKNNGSGHLYDASSITVLEGLEPVRKRPGMYIGTTGPDGLHHLITEIFDNARDEAMGGFANDIEVALLPGNRVRVVDNGRGIPVDTHKQTKVSALETIMTTLHAGGKFGGEGYKVSGGLHGVGASVVNALSVWMEVVVHRDGGAYRQEYERGEPKAKVKKIDASTAHGTIVSFEPDTKIFPEISFSWDKVISHMREQAYLVKGLRISVWDARAFPEKLDLADVFYLRELELDVPSQTFYFEGGLSSLVAFYNENFKPVHRHIFAVAKPVEGVEEVAVALQYADDISARILAFANNIANPEGGTHITGFKTALTRTLNTYARSAGLMKESDDNFTGDDCMEGLTAVVSVKLREIQFEGQTKAKLGSMEAQGAVAAVFGEAFAAFLEERPEDARAIIGKVALALRARKAAKAAKESVLRKGALEGMTLPGKLADCETKSAEEAELFVVEGDSAGGCFSGDTQVALLDGRNLSFKELVEEDKKGRKNYCYTIDAQGAVQVAPILYPRVTRKDTEVLKIILDDGEEIVCTPDHRFMLRDGSYKQASELTSRDSLMPLRRQTSKIGEKIIIHQTYLRKALAVLHDIWRNHGRIDEALYNSIRKEKKDKSLIRLQTITNRFFGGEQVHLDAAVANFNHRIKKVERVTERHDVYDLEVPGTHNFALASGVFVHNSGKQGRDRRTQAVLPLKGKILNVERARLDKILGFAEIKSLVIALGTGISDSFDVSKLRYHKIIIATDADVDGAHIRTLLLTLFYRYFRALIDGGFIYIAQPPLYKIKRGKEFFYAFSDEEKVKLLRGAEIAEESSAPETSDTEMSARESSRPRGNVGTASVQRYKGLGEMNPEELWETTMDPARRTLKKVRVEDAQEADKTFDILMGEDVAARKAFIQTNATRATLDI